MCLRFDSKVQPCCRYDGGFDLDFKGDILQVMNSPEMTDLRTRSAANEELPGCSKCHRQEAAGVASLRDWFNIVYPVDTSLQSVSAEHMKYLEIFVGDVCNLKCMTCDGKLSSSWRSDYEKLGWQLPPRSEVDLRVLDSISQLESLEEIKFVGGEPLLSKFHDDILSVLSDKSAEKMTLRYNTNVTQPPTLELRERWKKFKKIRLDLSIDGVGKVNEFIRYPSKWSVVEGVASQFVQASKEMPNIELRVICTVSCFNVGELNELKGWMSEIGLDELLINPVVDPALMRPSNIPEQYFAEVLASYENSTEEIIQFAEYLSQNKQSFDSGIVRLTENITDVRKIHVADYLSKWSTFQNEDRLSKVNNYPL